LPERTKEETKRHVRKKEFPRKPKRTSILLQSKPLRGGGLDKKSQKKERKTMKGTVWKNKRGKCEWTLHLRNTLIEHVCLQKNRKESPNNEGGKRKEKLGGNGREEGNHPVGGQSHLHQVRTPCNECWGKKCGDKEPDHRGKRKTASGTKRSSSRQEKTHKGG